MVAPARLQLRHQATINHSPSKSSATLTRSR
jgi:hypothetical protein